MHTKGDIKYTITELLAHIFIRLATFEFVEDDKLDIRYVAQEHCFSLADDPSNLRIRPVILDASNDGQGMTGVANRRETNDTYFFRLRF